MMTKQNFEAAAKLVAMHYSIASDNKGAEEIRLLKQAEAIQETFVVFFRQDNPKFDAIKFRTACEPKVKK